MRILKDPWTVAVISTISILAAHPARAQTGTEVRFLAASLKPLAAPATPAAPPGEEILTERVVRTAPGVAATPGLVSPGRIHYAGSLREFLSTAYDVKEFQVEGPAWIDTERFVLDATLPPETGREQRLLMLQNLLVERFKMTSHLQPQERPVYSMVVARGGLKIAASRPAPDQRTDVRTVASTGRARITAQAATMQVLADQLTRQLDRPVTDKTGNTGRYDFVVTFSTDGLNRSANPITAVAAQPHSEESGRSWPSALPDARELPNLFAAVQSQLGLKLEAQKGLVDILVIDRIDRTPTDN